MDYIDIAMALSGDWHICRVVLGQATMRGLGVFTPTKMDLYYREHGQVMLSDGQTFNFSRSYIYRFKSGVMEVVFDEGPPRLFQTVALTNDGEEIAGDGWHNCEPDTYSSRYRFSPGRFLHHPSGRGAAQIIRDRDRLYPNLSGTHLRSAPKPPILANSGRTIERPHYLSPISALTRPCAPAR